MTFTVKDSGAREEYASGMKRDTTEGKPDYTLIPLEFLERWAWHMTKGAEKYGRANWRLAAGPEELERFEASAFRHLMQWLQGDRDEDHASAVAFNVAAAEYVRGRIAEAEKATGHGTPKPEYIPIKPELDTPEPPKVVVTFSDLLTPELERAWSRLLQTEVRRNGFRSA